jgi:ABC-type nitrate/sulfonate/bicarbonate transport system substrate-binding protein
LLRQWLRAGGINPDRDVHLVVVPPPLMFSNLVAGHLDGFCVGEPWNTVTTQAHAGVSVAVSCDLAPLHPEKVLMVRADFAEQRADEHCRLIAALIEAAAYCDKAEHRPQIAEILAQPRYVNAPNRAIRASLEEPDHHIFGANEPSAEKANWVLTHMGLTDVPSRYFRRDIYLQAMQLTQGAKQHEITAV